MPVAGFWHLFRLLRNSRTRPYTILGLLVLPLFDLGWQYACLAFLFGAALLTLVMKKRARRLLAIHIEIGLETRTTVNLLICNSAGCLVRSLADGWLNPGVYVVTWDGNDQLGDSVAPGSYVAKLRAGGKILTHNFRFGVSERAEKNAMMQYLLGHGEFQSAGKQELHVISWQDSILRQGDIRPARVTPTIRCLLPLSSGGAPPEGGQAAAPGDHKQDLLQRRYVVARSNLSLRQYASAIPGSPAA